MFKKSEASVERTKNMLFKIDRSFLLFSLSGAITVSLLSATGVAMKLLVHQSSYFGAGMIFYVGAVGALFGLVASVLAYGLLFTLRNRSNFIVFPLLIGSCLGFLCLLVLIQGRVSSLGQDLLGLLLFPIIPWLLSVASLHHLAMKHIRTKSF